MRQADADAGRLFDLKTGPLVRAMLFRLDEADHLLCLTHHHIGSDRHSTFIFANELAALYDAFIENRPASLPPLPIQYSDYAIWQRQNLLTGYGGSRIAILDEAARRRRATRTSRRSAAHIADVTDRSTLPSRFAGGAVRSARSILPA